MKLYKNEFIRLRFNELPKIQIMNFLQHICDEEKYIYRLFNTRRCNIII